MVQLRDYQRKAINGIVKQLRTSQSTLVVSPTGTGKTILFAEAARMASGRCMVIAHREELLSQAADKIQRSDGSHPDIEQAALYASTNPLFKTKTVVASIQSLNSRLRQGRRFERFEPSDFTLVVIDEAHHAVANSYKRVIEWFKKNPRCKVVGFTATPDRFDKLAMGMVFESVAFDYNIADAVSDGWLVPIRNRIVRVEGLDFSAIRSNKNDFNQKELSVLMEYEEVLHGIAVPTIELSKDRKTLVFAASVHQAQRLAEIFDRYKPNSAGFVSGKCPSDKRRDTIRKFREGRLQTLVNVGVATEGFDVDDIGCVSIARPTKSRALYSQMVGRGTRPEEGLVDAYQTPEDRRRAIAASNKPDCLIIDFTGNAGRHRLIHATDILGGEYPEEVRDLALKIVESGATQDVGEAIEKANVKYLEEKEEEEKRKRKIVRASKVDYSTKDYEPFGALGISQERIVAAEKSNPRGLSGNQMAFLTRAGVNLSRYSRGEQRVLYGEMVRRIKAGKCSLKQARVLKKYGVETKSLSFKHASDLLTRLADNNWKQLEF